MGATAPEITVGLTSLPVTSETSSAPVTTNQEAQSDDDVLLGEFLARPRFVGSFTWAAATAYDSVPYSASILSALLSDTDMMLKLRGFANAKFDLNVRIQCAGSPYFTGGLAVGWRPTGGGCNGAPVFTDTPTLHPAQLLQLPAHALLDPSTRDNIDLKLPFIHINGIYDLATPVAYDYLKFSVLNVLRTTGSEAASMVITVHAWMTNVQLSAPTYQSERAGSVVRSGRPAAQVMRGFASAFARGAADIALTSVGLGAPALAPITRAVEENTPSLTSNGATSLVTLSQHAGTESPIDSLVSSDELSFSSISSREGWLTRILWNNGAPANLAVIPVLPTTLPTTVTIGTTPTANAFLYTPTGYISLPFSYWRGTMRFRIEVRCNKFCTGTIRVRYLPRAYTSPAFNIKASDVLSKSLDITTGTEMTIDCPFSANRPWLRVNHTIVNDTGSDYSNGMIVIDYIEGLKSSTVPVEVNVYMSCPDLELSGLMGNTNFDTMSHNVSTNPAADPTYQSWSNDQYYNVRDAIKLPRVAWIHQRTMLVGKKANFEILPDATFAQPVPTAQKYPIEWTIVRTPLQHFAGLYLARTGGLRYTVQVAREGGSVLSSDIAESVRYIAGKKPVTSTYAVGLAGDYTALYLGLTNALAQPGALAIMTNPRTSIVFDSAASGQSNWVPARSVANKSNGQLRFFSEPIQHTVFSGGDDDNYYSVIAMVSGSDDAGLSYFLCVPFIVRPSNYA